MELIPKDKRIIKRVKAWEHRSLLERVSEDIKAARKSGDTDDPVETFLYDPVAIKMTHGFIKAGWSANAVTCLSLVVGVAGSVLFYPQNRWINLIGIFMEIFAVLLDCCDGQIARLTHTSSQMGRFLDGLVDTTNFLAVYIFLGLRMMKETIPFTNRPWSFYIWAIVLVTMLFHAGQSRMADYYRGLHLYFLHGRSSASLARTKDLKAELAALPKNSPLYERIYRIFYLIYTDNQEKRAPWAQRLLDALESKGTVLTEDVSEEYVQKSRRYIQLTNVLTYHPRAYALYLLLFLGLHVYYFPIVLIVLEAVKWFMIIRYETIAKDLYQHYCSDGRQ